MAVEIVPLSNTPRDTRLFLSLEPRVYRDYPCWVAGFRSERESFLRTGPFHDHGESQLFLATRGSRPIARLCVHTSSDHDGVHGAGRGFFGFFEALDDEEAVSRLFQNGAGWLRSHRCREMVGPMSFGIHDEFGLLINRFQEVSPVACPYNPPYYSKLLEGVGFRKSVDWFSFRIDRSFQAPPFAQRIRERALKGDGISLRAVNPSDWQAESTRLRAIFNEAWADNWGHVPMRSRQWADILRRMRPAIVPGLSLLACHRDRPVGMAVTIRDFHEVLSRMKRRTEWWDKLSLLCRLSRVRSLRTVLFGVLEPYRHRGLETALILESFERGVRMGYRVCDCSQIVETNERMCRTLTKLGLEKTRIWRIYGREIA